MSQTANISGIVFVTGKLLPEEREEAGLPIKIGEGYGEPNTIIFFVAKANLDVNTLQARINEGGTGFSISLDTKYRGGFYAIHFSGSYIQDTINEITGDFSEGGRQTGASRSAQFLMNIESDGRLGRAANRVGEFLQEGTKKPAKNKITDSPKLNHLIEVVNSLIHPQD